jgi:hypothetical protein
MSELLNVATVAAILKVSPDTVVRRFSRVKGVVNLGSEETRGKRRYRVLRIPQHVVEKYVGHPITIPTVTPKRGKSEDALRAATENLAKAVKEHAPDNARAHFDESASNARMLTFVPEKEWKDVQFVAQDDQEDDRLLTRFYYPGEEGR